MVAMLAPSDDDAAAVDDDDVVKEAYERFEACKDFQGKEDERRATTSSSPTPTRLISGNGTPTSWIVAPARTARTISHA